jgi:dihydrodipicolinate synthase/N-acetylneuraminate lyase
MTRKRSAFVMSITPFTADGTFDETAYRIHLRRLAAAGVGVYVGGSASGEGFSLSPAERDRVLAIAAEELRGKVNVRAMGTEVRHLADTLDYLAAVGRHDLDAVHIFAPEMGHASKPTYAELDAYYSAAIAATQQPVILSCYQALGFDLPIGLLESLAQRHQHFIGFFYGGSDVRYLSSAIARLATRLEIHCAGPYNAITTMALGGTGFMGHEGNLSPELAMRVVTAFETGDLLALQDAYAKLMAVHAMHYRLGGPVRAMKPLLNALGLPGGYLRLPRMAITDAQLADVLRDTLALRIPGLPASPAS